jgi:hypothetical protein
MNLWLSIFLVWLIASLPFAWIVGRIIRRGQE